MKIFDALTWIGRWPFTFQPTHTPRTLAMALRRQRIARALVSPLDAVFAPEPGPANRALLVGCRGKRALVPVPIINPALANWREQLDAVAEHRGVRAVRLLPNYHNYRLTSTGVNELVSELKTRGLRLLISMRLIDERHEYFALNLSGVPASDLDRFLQRHDGLPVLASGLLRPDLLSLLPKHPALLADLSFAEWFDTLGYLLRRVPSRQLVFASHTPFLITAAAKAKVALSVEKSGVLASISSGNLEKFLNS